MYMHSYQVYASDNFVQTALNSDHQLQKRFWHFEHRFQEVISFLYRSKKEMRPQGYKTFFMLNSAMHDIYPAH